MKHITPPVVVSAVIVAVFILNVIARLAVERQARRDAERIRRQMAKRELHNGGRS